jgi:hypothetical protein
MIGVWTFNWSGKPTTNSLSYDVAYTFSKRSVLWDISLWKPLKINRRFGGSYRHHLQGRRINQTRNQKRRTTKQPTLLDICFTLVACLTFSSTLRMETACSYEISFNFRWTTRFISQNIERSLWASNPTSSLSLFAIANYFCVLIKRHFFNLLRRPSYLSSMPTICLLPMTGVLCFFNCGHSCSRFVTNAQKEVTGSAHKSLSCPAKQESKAAYIQWSTTS